MIIEKKSQQDSEYIKYLEDRSDLIAPEGCVYKNKNLPFMYECRYVTFKTYYYLLGKPLTKESIKQWFGVDQLPPYIETEADYELIELKQDVQDVSDESNEDGRG